MIEAIKKTNVSEETFYQMKKLILNRSWKEGDKLPSEYEMSEQFGVSRGTVRGALQKLSTLGLIETRIGEGSYVKRSDNSSALSQLIPTAYFEEDVETILEYRREIEAGTCAIAAKKATDKDVKELRQMLEHMESLQDDLDQLALAEIEFHYKIAQISRNPLIIKTYEIIADIYKVHMEEMVNKMGGDSGIYFHKTIVDAIEEGDVSKARKYMFHHIDENQSFINKHKTNKTTSKTSKTTSKTTRE